MILGYDKSDVFISLRPRQKGRHVADDIFKRIFFNENIWISITISLKFVPEGSIVNKSALVQVMVCYLFGAKSSPETMVT